MATTGVTGGAWRADVTATGTLVPWDGSAPLTWFVAADDRWHDPTDDAGVRHARIDGTAVFETKVRVPSGDVVQRIWSVPDAGGVTLVEVRNDSSLPVACAFTRGDLLTTRPPADVPIEGIDVPAGSIVVPVGHRSRAVVGLAHTARSPGVLPAGLPDSDAVARGWAGRADAASRLSLPDDAIVEAVRAARCEVALGAVGDLGDDPARFLLAVGELARMGELAPAECSAVAADVAAAVTGLAGRHDGLAAAARRSAGVVLTRAGERRAVGDLAGIERLAPPDAGGEPIAPTAPDDVLTVAAVEGRLAAGPRLFPGGIPKEWMGQDVEGHGLIAGPTTRLSLALRWHGANVAVLWECNGEPVRLTSDAGAAPWSTTEPRGAALWRLPMP